MKREAAVLASEPVALVVSYTTLLTPPGDGVDRPGLGTDAEVAILDVRFDPRVRADAPAEESRCTVEPVVERRRETVHSRLVVVRREPGVEHASFVGLSVAVVISRQDDVWRRADEDRVAPDRHARREG